MPILSDTCVCILARARLLPLLPWHTCGYVCVMPARTICIAVPCKALCTATCATAGKQAFGQNGDRWNVGLTQKPLPNIFLYRDQSVKKLEASLPAISGSDDPTTTTICEALASRSVNSRSVQLTEHEKCKLPTNQQQIRKTCVTTLILWSSGMNIGFTMRRVHTSLAAGVVKRFAKPVVSRFESSIDSY